MINKREELIQRNKNFIQIPMPKLSEMTIEELEKRAEFFEQAFEVAFNEQESTATDL